MLKHDDPGVTMQFHAASRRAVAVVLGAGMILVAATACAPDRTVTPDVPPQVEGAFAEDVQTQVDAAVASAMAATGSTGAIVGVWAPWSGSSVAAVGDAGTDDMFRIAEVTRAMTCDVLFQEVAAGTVDLDDSLTDYVATIAGIPDTITLGTLCNGTSGIGSYSERVGPDFLQTPDRRWNPNELAAYGVGSRDDTLIGNTWRDSDAAYVLLGLALEKATGRSAADLYDDEVFTPLGMTHSRLPSDAAAAPGEPALTGLRSAPDAEGVMACEAPADVTVLSASMGFTNSGVVSTIDDLGQYARALATQALLPDDADRFANPLPVGADQPSWFATTGGAYIAGSLIGQYGSAPGYLTAAFADPATGLTVALVLNNSAADDSVAAFLAWELAAIASKAPAASGQTAPAAGLPWTAQQFHDEIIARAVCPLPES